MERLEDILVTVALFVMEKLEPVAELVVGVFLLGHTIVFYFIIHRAVDHWGFGGIVLSLVGALFLTAIAWRIYYSVGSIVLYAILFLGYGLLLACCKIVKPYFEWFKDCIAGLKGCIAWFYRHLRS